MQRCNALRTTYVLLVIRQLCIPRTLFIIFFLENLLMPQREQMFRNRECAENMSSQLIL